MIKKILNHRAVSSLSFIALSFVVGGTVWAYGSLADLGSGPVILHFDDMAGITQVGSVNFLIAVGILGIIAVILNSILAFALDDRDPFLGKFMAGMTLAFAFLLFLGFASILGVN